MAYLDSHKEYYDRPYNDRLASDDEPPEIPEILREVRLIGYPTHYPFDGGYYDQPYYLITGLQAALEAEKEWEEFQEINRRLQERYQNEQAAQENADATLLRSG